MKKIKIYKADEKIKGLCSRCDKITTGTLKQKDYHYKSEIIPGILQLFCDECGNYMGKPYQSSVRINKYLIEKKEKDVSVRVPGHLIDVLYLIGKKLKLEPEPNSIWKAITKLYAFNMKNERIKNIDKLYAQWLKDDLSAGKTSFKLTCRMDDNTYEIINYWSDHLHISKSDLWRGIIVGAKQDILDEKNNVRFKNIEKNIHLVC